MVSLLDGDPARRAAPRKWRQPPDSGESESMQHGVVALRGAVSALWEDDLRAVRLDSFDVSAGKEALAFIQRFYSLVSQLRTPIQRAWGLGGLVHVADSADIAGPGQ